MNKQSFKLNYITDRFLISLFAMHKSQQMYASA